MTVSRTYTLPTPASAVRLAGAQNENLKIFTAVTESKLVMRGLDLLLEGTENQVSACEQLIEALKPLWSKDLPIAAVDIRTAQEAIKAERLEQWQERTTLIRTRRGETVQPRTLRQQQYVAAMDQYDLVFGIGPAGTGKTYLAALKAVKALQEHQFERIILTRPAVEAGEKLGFLPGDLQQKVNPYLRPLYDAIHEIIDPEKVPAMIERGIIEIAPLAYMRGRTLSKSFIIVDEAQNTTAAQMKMILTRLGNGSRMIVTGDITQTDLPRHQKSGLVMAMHLLRHVEGISFTLFTQKDVVRHPLVQRIIDAYENKEHNS